MERQERQQITIENLKDYITFLDGECWSSVKGYENRYFISNRGRLFGTRKRKLLVPFYANNGNGKYPEDKHLNITLCRDYKIDYRKIHTLVAEAFLVKPNTNEKLVVHHVDCNPHNNDIRNLMWLPVKKHLQIHSLLRKFNKNLVEFDMQENQQIDKIA